MTDSRILCGLFWGRFLFVCLFNLILWLKIKRFDQNTPSWIRTWVLTPFLRTKILFFFPWRLFLIHQHLAMQYQISPVVIIGWLPLFLDQWAVTWFFVRLTIMEYLINFFPPHIGNFIEIREVPRNQLSVTGKLHQGKIAIISLCVVHQKMAVSTQNPGSIPEWGNWPVMKNWMVMKCYLSIHSVILRWTT